MSMRIALLLALAGAGTLAGCGSSGSSGSGGGELGYGERLDRLQDTVLAINEEDLTDGAALPDGGSARYEGHALLSVGATAEDPGTGLLGDLALEVGFAEAGSVSGTIGDFVDAEDRRYAGTIALSGGAIDRAFTGMDGGDPAFVLAATGSLKSRDGVDYVLSDGSEAEGDFFGGGAAHVAGAIDGTVCAAGGDCVALEGSFAGTAGD